MQSCYSSSVRMSHCLDRLGSSGLFGGPDPDAVDLSTKSTQLTKSVFDLPAPVDPIKTTFLPSANTCHSVMRPMPMSKPLAYCTPNPVPNIPENNQVRLVEYRGSRLAAFAVDGRELVCLPQAFELFLKHLVGGLHTVYTKLKRLEIVPVVCNVEQVRILRGLGAIQPGVNRCKLIAPSEFDVLYADCTNSSARPGRPSKRITASGFPPSPTTAASNNQTYLSLPQITPVANSSGSSDGEPPVKHPRTESNDGEICQAHAQKSGLSRRHPTHLVPPYYFNSDLLCGFTPGLFGPVSTGLASQPRQSGDLTGIDPITFDYQLVNSLIGQSSDQSGRHAESTTNPNDLTSPVISGVTSSRESELIADRGSNDLGNGFISGLGAWKETLSVPGRSSSSILERMSSRAALSSVRTEVPRPWSSSRPQSLLKNQYDSEEHSTRKDTVKPGVADEHCPQSSLPLLCQTWPWLGRFPGPLHLPLPPPTSEVFAQLTANHRQGISFVYPSQRCEGGREGGRTPVSVKEDQMEHRSDLDQCDLRTAIFKHLLHGLDPLEMKDASLCSPDNGVATGSSSADWGTFTNGSAAETASSPVAQTFSSRTQNLRRQGDGVTGDESLKEGDRALELIAHQDTPFPWPFGAKNRNYSPQSPRKLASNSLQVIPTSAASLSTMLDESLPPSNPSKEVGASPVVNYYLWLQLIARSMGAGHSLTKKEPGDHQKVNNNGTCQSVD